MEFDIANDDCFRAAVEAWLVDAGDAIANIGALIEVRQRVKPVPGMIAGPEWTAQFGVTMRLLNLLLPDGKPLVEPHRVVDRIDALTPRPASIPTSADVPPIIDLTARRNRRTGDPKP